MAYAKQQSGRRSLRRRVETGKGRRHDERRDLAAILGAVPRPEGRQRSPANFIWFRAHLDRADAILDKERQLLGPSPRANAVRNMRPTRRRSERQAKRIANSSRGAVQGQG
jgi:hypothetical protein